MTMRLRCRCGQVQGELAEREVAAHMICYCKDCRAYARYLGMDAMLDAAGGTELCATLPASVRFTQGQEHIACMSLSPKGLLRWYAACCRTPLGNTPRERKQSYLGVARMCIDVDDAALASAVGQPVPIQTKSALLPVASSALRGIGGIVGIVAMLVKAQVTGRWKVNPLFDAASGEPIRQPEVVPLEQKAALYA